LKIVPDNLLRVHVVHVTRRVQQFEQNTRPALAKDLLLRIDREFLDSALVFCRSKLGKRNDVYDACKPLNHLQRQSNVLHIAKVFLDKSGLAWFRNFITKFEFEINTALKNLKFIQSREH
jgi:hypothetical protein